MLPILTVENIVKKYPTTLALDNVNMTINRGDIYGFVGENGAGKSTLIRLITNVINPTSGTIKLNIENRLGNMAAIVETPALHHKLNAVDNLKYQATILNIEKNDEEIKELLLLVGLKDQVESKKHSKNFSLGMKQRLAIAMALIGDPEFILLDEPMNGLDPVGIKEVRELILKLNKEHNKTFLISSHILTELDKIATTYGFISHGRLVKEISAKELHSKVFNMTRITLLEPLKADVIEKLNTVEFSFETELTLITNNEKDGQKLMQLLVGNGVIIDKFEVVKDTIEDYYFEIITKGEKKKWKVF